MKTENIWNSIFRKVKSELLNVKRKSGLVFFIVLFGYILAFSQSKDFTLAGVEYFSLIESQPNLPNYTINKDGKMSANDISAFVNFGYRLSPKTMAFHAVKWGHKDYSITFEEEGKYMLPPYLQSLPTMSCLDLTSAILHDFSSDWGLTGMARVSLTNGSGTQDLKGDFNYIGLFVIKRKWDKNELGLGGFVYQGVAKTVYLPLIPLNFEGAKWRLKGTLPLTLSVRYEASPKIFLGINHEVGSSGYTYQTMENPNTSWEEAQNIELLKWMIGPTVSWRMTPHFELTAKSGLYNYDFTIQTNEGTEESLQFKNGFYVGLGLNYVIQVDGK